MPTAFLPHVSAVQNRIGYTVGLRRERFVCVLAREQHTSDTGTHVAKGTVEKLRVLIIRTPNIFKEVLMPTAGTAVRRCGFWTSLG